MNPDDFLTSIKAPFRDVSSWDWALELSDEAGEELAGLTLKVYWLGSDCVVTV